MFKNKMYFYLCRPSKYLYYIELETNALPKPCTQGRANPAYINQ